MSYDPQDDPSKIFKSKKYKELLETTTGHAIENPVLYTGEKIETTKEEFEMQEGGKLELVEVKRWNGREYRTGYGQIFKHTLTGSRLPFYMNHNYAICEKVFYDLRKQFKKKS